jgi:hypothetical protein
MSPFAARVRVLAGGAVGVAFVAVIGLPLASKLLHFDWLTPVSEFRMTATQPPLPRDRAALDAFPAEFEAYYNDHFGLRSAFIRGMHLVKGRWLGTATAANVLVGLDGWLYFTERPAGTDYDAVRPFTADELRRWCRILQKRHDWLARKGVRYILFIPPDKQTVYPEHLPPELRSRHAQSRLDQLAAELRQHSTVPFLDVRAALWQAREREQVFDATDSHWNPRGAFVGYQALVGRLAEWFPAVRPLPRSAFVDTACRRAGGDLAQMSAQERVRTEEALGLESVSPRQAQRCAAAGEWAGDCRGSPPQAVECHDPALPRALMFHDSFTWALGPFLAEHFRRIVFVWTDQFSPELVRRERPEVVIQQLVERKLGTVVPADFDDNGD